MRAAHRASGGAGRSGAGHPLPYIDGSGEIGVIASVTRPFCGTCDRNAHHVRRRVRNCLFSDDEASLRDILRSGGSDRTWNCCSGARCGASFRATASTIPVLTPEPLDVDDRRLMARLRLFGPARSAAGIGEASAPGETVATSWPGRATARPDFAELLGQCRIWVNGEPAEREWPVAAMTSGVIPPVSGG